MKVRNLAALFFLVYGALIPILASKFVEDYQVASLALIGSCILIAALLWTGKAVLINLMIAMYVFRIYLVKPYAGVFMHHLHGRSLAYIESLHLYFNPTDAAVVYLSLFSLLLAWTLGLVVTRPQRVLQESRPIWVFRQIDRIVTDARWSFWLIWLLLFALNYKSATESWQFATGQGSPAFAFGLLGLSTINIACLYAFIRSRQPEVSKSSLMLLLPVLISGIYGSAGGSRGAIFYVVTLAFSYWLFVNYGKRLKIRRLLGSTALTIIVVPVMVFGGLFAQLLRPLLRSGANAETVQTAVLNNLDLSAPNNPLANTFYFGVSELLHRLSNLQQSVLILNDHFLHQPWDHVNPLAATMRIVNDLVPGDVFPGILTINQIFRYIYQDTLVTYSSDMWSIQGTLYLYFGLWFSPLVVFGLACFVAQKYLKLESVALSSPSFAAFFIIMFNDLIENGTLDRVIPVDIVRPLVGFYAIVFLVRLIQSLRPRPGIVARNRLQGMPYARH